MLLFSTDYPHWQFDGLGAMPPGIDPGLAKKIMADNPLRSYVRLQQQTAEMEPVA
jgi:predicted TIM-barrel fold metal-dependent hydrolase